MRSSKTLSLERKLVIADELEKFYHPKKRQLYFFNLTPDYSIQHLSFIKLLKHLTQGVKESIYSGNASINDTYLIDDALVFEQEYVRLCENNGKPPLVSEGWLYSTGSRLYTAIASNIGSVNEDDKLTCVNRFYQFVNTKLREKDIHHIVYWGDRKHLLEDIESTLFGLKKESFERIKLLSEGIPTLSALQKNIKKIQTDYRQATADRWFENKDRNLMLELSDLINQTCDDFYPQDKKSDPCQLTKNYKKSCMVRLGMALFILHSIYGEYRIFSPEGIQFINKGSELFKEYLKAINIKKINQFNDDRKMKWLEKLLSHVKRILADHEQTYQINKQELEMISKRIQKQIDFLEENKNPSSWTATAVKSAVQGGTGLIISKCVAQVIAPGSMGIAVFFGGGFVMSQLSKMVADQVIQPAVANVFAWVLNRLGNEMANSAVDAVTYIFFATKEGLQKILSHPSFKSEDKKYFNAWINTLLKLPDSVMSKEEKDQIRNVLGIEDKFESSFVIMMS